MRPDFGLQMQNVNGSVHFSDDGHLLVNSDAGGGVDAGGEHDLDQPDQVRR